MGQYRKNVAAWAAGIVWLWTREAVEVPGVVNRVDGRAEPLRRWVRDASRWDRRRPPMPTQANSIDYKDGYGPLRFLPLYVLNYGTRTLAGGQVVSWSKWFYLTRGQYRASKLITRVLNFFDRRHGYEAGPTLWGTVATAWAPRGAVVFWAAVVPALVALAAWRLLP
jgi:hypothetical protein